MAVLRNSIANYIGQGYSVVIGIIIMPFYLQYLGAEAYGLVGFFVLMQAWLYMLDMGLSPTLGRQIAFARGQGNGFDTVIKLLRSFEIIFLILAVLTVSSIYFSSIWIAQHWIEAESISSDTIAYCISIMGLLIGLRWFFSLYRSGIIGMEDQVWLNIINVLIVSLKFIGALLLLQFVTKDIKHFFEYQLLVGVIEAGIVGARFYQILPISASNYGFKFHYQSMKNIAPFALGIAYTSGIWILITQTDKLILSGILTLSEFGYFSLVTLVSGGLIILTGPIMQAILPRMTMLLSKNSPDDMLALYRKASQFVAVIVLPATFVIAFYSKELIYAWTGDMMAAEWGSHVLFWFSLGNGVLALSIFQYYLQSAYGKLRLHVIGSTISALIQIPIIYYAAVNYGAEGAGMAWFGFRLIWFMWWIPIVHKKFAPGLHVKWLLNDLLPIIIVSISIVSMSYYVIPVEDISSRLQLFGLLGLISLVTLLFSAFSSSAVRALLTSKITRDYAP